MPLVAASVDLDQYAKLAPWRIGLPPYEFFMTQLMRCNARAEMVSSFDLAQSNLQLWDQS
jgi:hypothetical protein